MNEKTKWTAPMYDPDERLVDVDTVASFLGVSARTVHRWTKEQGLPCYRIGGTLRFQIPDIKQWLMQYREGGETSDDS